MITATRHTIEYDEFKEVYKIRNVAAPICPKCGLLLSGYDTRRRHVIDNSGKIRWFLLRRLRCLNCNKLHLELPDYMQPKKHYEASIIIDVITDHAHSCPADNATIRRWRKGNTHPVCLYNINGTCYSKAIIMLVGGDTMKRTFIYVIVATVFSSAFLVIAGVFIGSKLNSNPANIPAAVQVTDNQPAKR